MISVVHLIVLFLLNILFIQLQLIIKMSQLKIGLYYINFLSFFLLFFFFFFGNQTNGDCKLITFVPI